MEPKFCNELLGFSLPDLDEACSPAGEFIVIGSPDNYWAYILRLEAGASSEATWLVGFEFIPCAVAKGSQRLESEFQVSFWSPHGLAAKTERSDHIYVLSES